ncbi:MAG: ATP-binding protein [Mariprofundaceae bacterium]|nr:ATP-binding protein [Mariprofundaceae bacterium]
MEYTNPQPEFPLLDMIPLAMVLVNVQGHITHANELAQSHMGTSLRRMAGRHLADFVQPSSELKAMLERALQGETVAYDAFCGRHNHMPYSLHFGPMQRQQGVVIGFIPEANRSEVEEYTKRHEMAETVARIALEMAHEVKNPLAALRGAAQLLHEQSTGDAADISAHILQEVDRIKDRIDAFLQVGPRANVAMEAINIHALLDDVSIHSGEIEVRRVYDPSLPNLWVHETRLRQAFENLWVNALEAGSTVITWETRIAPLVALPDHQGIVVAISMRSNGQAIPKALRSHLFEPYVSGKARGSGLGLAVVQRVVQEHGGRVSLKEGAGDTVFMIHLPIEREKL